jgi:hypothetical protein
LRPRLTDVAGVILAVQIRDVLRASLGIAIPRLRLIGAQLVRGRRIPRGIDPVHVGAARPLPAACHPKLTAIERS